MPRKPVKSQRSYDLSKRGRNHVISWCRHECKSATYLRKRYFIGRITGVIRTNGMKSIIHNGGKP